MAEFFEMLLDYLPYACFALISAVAVVITVYDKYAAKHRTDARVPEKRLFLVAALGGAIFMLTSMLIVRHKTMHKRFMIGLPIIIVLQFTLAIVLLTVL